MEKALLIIIIAAAAFLSCGKEKEQDTVTHEQTQEQQKEPEQPAMTSFTAIITDYDYGDTKAAIAENNSLRKAIMCWESGDRISVNGQVFTGEASGPAAVFTNPSADVVSPYKAIYPASLDIGTGEYTFHAVQTYTEGKAGDLPMYACSENSILTFHNICAVLAIKIPQGSTATRIEVSSGKAMNGKFTIDENNAAVMKKTDNLTDDEKKVTVHGNFPSGSVVYVAVPPANYADLTIKIITASETITHTRALNAAANNVYHLNIPPAGALNGLFTVQDPDGDAGSGDEIKVYFSRGNLYYDGSAFQFEANQYDYRHYCGKSGDAAVIVGRATTTPERNVGSFFWSKTVSVAMASSYSDGSATASDIFFTNTTPTTPKADFMVNGTAGIWRTLSGGSDGECNYLLYIRKVLAGGEQKVPYGEGTVNGVHGLILLPDDWNGSVCPGFIYGASAFTNKFTNTTTPTWSEMEAAGVIFLPGAGSRLNNNVGAHGIGSYGLYWPSTPSSRNSCSVCDMSFYSNCVYIYDGSGNNRYYGYSVRLVCTAQ